MRADSFEDIEAFRLVPQTTRKAMKQWRGNVRFACATEEVAQAVANCLVSQVNDSASWDGGDVTVDDNIVTIVGLSYQARSANANDAEQLVRRCCSEYTDSLISPVAVQTMASHRLGPGR